MDMDPTIVIVALLALAVGAGLGFWLGTARQSRKVMQAGAIKAEYDEYREQVTRHFGQAAEHFQTIGREYQALYQHMASGADALCAVRDAGNKLSFVPGDDEDGGARSADGADSDGEDSTAAGSDEATSDEAPSDDKSSDARREDSAAANDAGHEAASSSAEPAAVDDGARSEQDGPAADKPERIYH